MSGELEVIDLDEVLRGERALGRAPDILAPAAEVTLDNLRNALGPSADRFVERARKCRVDVPPIGVVRLEGARLDTAGFARLNGTIAASLCQFSIKTLARRQGETDPGGPPIHLERAVSTVRPGDHIYGHWLVDILPRLWILHRAGLLSDTPVLLRQGLPSFVRPLLHAFGVRDEQLVEVDIRHQPVLVDELVVPSNLRYNQVFHPAMRAFAEWAYETVTGERPSGEPGDAKLYVSRSGWKALRGNSRKLKNAGVVEKGFEELGYAIVHPQRLPFSEQARLFRGAAIIAGEDGSGMHNTIFSRPGTVVQIVKSTRNAGLIQLALCHSLGQPVDVLFGAYVPDARPPRPGSPFQVDAALIPRLAG